MALIECPECKKSVSSVARACPYCGYPVAEQNGSVTPAEAVNARAASSGPGELLREVRPSWWGFFWHLVFFWLIVPLIVAIIRRHATVLRIYTNRINLERGIFSKCYQDFNPRDIRSIDVDQSFLQRMLGIGTIVISTAATVEASERIRSIPDPIGVKDLIIAQRGDD